jgi:branched-subunit amino acid transport protein
LSLPLSVSVLVVLVLAAALLALVVDPLALVLLVPPRFALPMTVFPPLSVLALVLVLALVSDQVLWRTFEDSFLTINSPFLINLKCRNLV